eukprot:2131811-Amphidinium_carterae.1
MRELSGRKGCSMVAIYWRSLSRSAARTAKWDGWAGPGRTQRTSRAYDLASSAKRVASAAL